MPILNFRRPRSNILLLLAFFFFIAFLYLIVHNLYQIRNTISYATRPLWDKDTAPKQLLPHYYSEGVTMDPNYCALHKFSRREGGTANMKVLDAFLMSSEVNLLEIRLNELDSVVDYFLIVESNATFTGLPKETFFANNKERFSKFSHKIVYELCVSSTLFSSSSSHQL